MPIFFLMYSNITIYLNIGSWTEDGVYLYERCLGSSNWDRGRHTCSQVLRFTFCICELILILKMQILTNKNFRKTPPRKCLEFMTQKDAFLRPFSPFFHVIFLPFSFPFLFFFPNSSFSFFSPASHSPPPLP